MDIPIIDKDVMVKKLIPSDITDKVYIALAYHREIKSWVVATSLDIHKRPEDATAKLEHFNPDVYDHFLVELKLPNPTTKPTKGGGDERFN